MIVRSCSRAAPRRRAGSTSRAKSSTRSPSRAGCKRSSSTRSRRCRRPDGIRARSPARQRSDSLCIAALRPWQDGASAGLPYSHDKSISYPTVPETGVFPLHCNIYVAVHNIPVYISFTEWQQRASRRCRPRNTDRTGGRSQFPQHGRPERTSVMTELSAGKTKATKAAAPVVPLFEFPQFELPKFELPKFDLPEAPAAFREVAEQGIAQAKAAYEKAKAAAEEATGVLERSYAAAAEGAAEYNRQVIDAARANVNAGFDYAIALLAVKSPTDVVEVSAAHVREQFQAMTEQAKLLGELARKLAAEAAEPIQTGVNRAFQNAA